MTFVKCLLFASFAVIVNWLPNLYLLAKAGGVAQAMLQQPRDPLYSLLAIICGLVGVAFSVAIILRQYAMLTAQPVGGELANSFRRLFSVILYFILFGLIIFGCALVVLPALFFSWNDALGTGGHPAAAAVLCHSAAIIGMDCTRNQRR